MADPLRAYGPSSWSRASAEFDLLIQELEDAFPQEHKREFSRRMRDPFYEKQYQLGYDEGRRAGADEAFREWQTRIVRFADILNSTLDPALWKGAVETYRAPVGTQISPELQRTLEAALWYRELVKLKPLFETLDKSSLFDFAGLAVAEVVRAMRLAGKQWVGGFYALNGEPRAQGYYAGKLIGGACADVLLSAVEEVAATGAGRLIHGTSAANRIDQLAKKRFSKRTKRPPSLDDALNEAAESARIAKRGMAGPIAGTIKKAAAEAIDLLKVLRSRLGSAFPQILEQLHTVDLEVILQKARAVKGQWRNKTLKGYIAERLYKHLPQFQKLRDSLLKGLKGKSHWIQRVDYEDIVTTAAAEATARELEVTDGLLVAYAADPKPGEPKVLILAVFESKSPSGIGKLVREAKGKGEPPVWAGQIHADHERLSELPVVINGVRYEPHEVVISRRETRWVAVLTKDNSLKAADVTRLSTQGFLVDQWNLPVTDRGLDRVADEVLRAVGN